METEELFYPEISAVLGGYMLNKGVEVEVYSDQASYFDWAKVRFTPQFQANISVGDKEPGQILLGYNGVLDTVFEGYVTPGGYNGGGFKDEIVLKDKMLLLEETTISNTFLDATPQEIISYCLAQAGVTEAKLSDTIYQPRAVVPIAQKNVISVIKEIGTIWGIKNRFFFSGGIFYWGEKPEQEKTYSFEYGVNIISLDKPLGLWELETVSAPFVKHSHKISVTHPKVSGEFEVKKVVFRTNETGFIRTYISFNKEKGGACMGPIEKMVQDIIDKKLSEEYPQVQLPAIMKARITKATPLGDEYEYDELTVENKEGGSTFEAKITGKWFEYNLKILTKDGDPDSRYPEIPGVKSKIQIKAGGIAAVALLYGELSPFIIGEVG